MTGKKACYLMFVLALSFSPACKKYSRGGWSNRAEENLKGPIFSGRIWTLKTFEVNFVDSVSFCKGGTSFGKAVDPVVKYRFVGAKPRYSASSQMLFYEMRFNDDKTHLLFNPVFEDDTLPFKFNGSSFERNIFFPEPRGNKDDRWEWKILKLKKSEMILIAEGIQKYKLVFKSND